MKARGSSIRITLCAAVLHGCVLLRCAAADTPVSGTISTSTTWTTAGSPYVLTGIVYVSGSPVPTLTIQPGVTVKFNSAAQLAINYPSGGVLVANGTSGSPILFTANGSTTPGFWLGLYLGSLTPTASQLSYVTVEYGGQTSPARGGVYIENTSPTLGNVTVRNSVIAGITVNGGSPSITNSTLTANSGPGMSVTAGNPSITSSTITSNTGYAISAAPAASLSGLTSLTVSGNGPGKDLIERQGGTISASQTWVPGSIPYVLTGGIQVSGNPVPTLTIQAGATVKFNTGTGLGVSWPAGGVLVANGTSGLPILFTANGSTTPGFWNGLYLGNLTATPSQLSYATVEYGGQAVFTRGGVHIENTSPTLSNVTVKNSVIAGITVNGGSPSMTNTTLTGNSGPGMSVTAGNPSITGSTITNNTGYAISAAPAALLSGLTGLTVSGNGPGKDFIERQGGTIAASQTWVAGSVPYLLTGGLQVSGSPVPTLTIQAGATVKFNTGTGLGVSWPAGGVLVANGTSGSPILFTANGSTTPGFWNGLYLGNLTATVSQLSYATVEYGGQAVFTRGGINIEGTSSTLSNVTVRNSVIAGITVKGGSPSITNSTLTANSGPGMSVTTGSPSISGSTITGNSGNGIDLSGGSASVTSDTITSNTGYAISAAPAASLSGLTGLTVSGNGPGKDVIERRTGTIAASQTWFPASIPYLLTGGIQVSGGPVPTLTIQPGVTVKFNAAASLGVSWPSGGVLVANGTAGSPILFTANGSTTPGFWGGLYLGSLTGTPSQLSYVTVEHGGYTPLTRGGIYIENTSPTLSNVTVRNSVIAGITVNGGSPSISSGTLTGNSGPGMSVTAGNPSITGSMITGNSGNGIDLSGGSASVTSDTITNNTGYAISAAGAASLSGLTGLTVSGNGPGKDLIERQGGTIPASQTWVLGSIPYVVTGGLLVSGNPVPTLTIQPGVTVKFNAAASLGVNWPSGGVLVANGTAGSPILFTANGSTTPGFWGCLYLGNFTATASQLSYVTVEYGGYTPFTRGGIHIQGTSPTLDHLTVRNSVIAGVTVSSASATIVNSSFVGNPAGVVNQSPAFVVNARLNWWNAASGPSGSGYGSGQSVSTSVLFEPWLTAAGSAPEFVSSATYDNRRFNPSSTVLVNWGLTSSQSASWTFTIANAQSQTVRTLTASGPSAAFTWNGRNDGGVLQPDGTYTYTVLAVAGTAATPAVGRTFLDSTVLVNITSPAAGQTLSNIFQNGVTDVPVLGSVQISGLTTWALEYGLGSVPASWTTISTGTQQVVTNTIGTWATLAVAGGLYSLRVRAYDDQTNSFSVAQTDTVGNFSVSQSVLQLSAPAGNTATYSSVVPFTLTETLTLKNAAGQVVRTLVNGVSRPAGVYNDVWNGKNDSAAFLSDGPCFYYATVTVGAQSFTWDKTSQYYNDWNTYQNLTPPAWDPFNNSPLILTYNFAQPGRVTIALKLGDGGGCAPPSICLVQDKYEESGSHTIAWAGVDSTGALRSDLIWNANYSSRATFSKNAIVLFGTKPSITNVTVTPTIFGPALGTQTVAFDLATFQSQAVTVSVTFLSQDSLSVLRTITLASQSPGHKTTSWDGHTDSGGLMFPGNYTVTVSTTDSLGNQASGQILTTIQY